MIAKRETRVAIYTRKSTEEGLDQAFNSLDAQREAGEAYAASQRSNGWTVLEERFDDGGFTGANLERPALRRLMTAVEQGEVDCVIVYKIDRLSRSLIDFMRLVDFFEQHHVAFVSVTQQLDTSSSMGRLVLAILASFAQFEREMISERTRMKMSASRRKGRWVGGRPILGYDARNGEIVVNEEEAQRVRAIFEVFLEEGSLSATLAELRRRNWKMKEWRNRAGGVSGGSSFSKSTLHALLRNLTYLGKIKHHEEVLDGVHQPIVSESLFAARSSYPKMIVPRDENS